MSVLNSHFKQVLFYTVKKTAPPIVLTLALIFGLSFSFKTATLSLWDSINQALFPATDSTIKTRSLIITGLKEMNQLTTAGMSTKVTVVARQERKISHLYLGDTNLVYEAVGRVQAGIDMTQLVAKEVDSQQQKIHIVLPQPYITDLFLDVNNSSVVARYKNWWGPDVGTQLHEGAQKEALQKIRAEACGNNILEAANSNAKKLIENILTKAGYKEVTVKTQKPLSTACSTPT